MSKAYQIENLDVYRKAINLGTRLYSYRPISGEENSAVRARMRETSLSMVLNLASGLGFWEPKWKVSHLAATKKALMELKPLLELMVALGVMTDMARKDFEESINDVAKMVTDLLHQANKREE
jgi:four helix bundle protein